MKYISDKVTVEPTHKTSKIYHIMDNVEPTHEILFVPQTMENVDSAQERYVPFK